MYSHGRPTNDIYTINFKKLEVLPLVSLGSISNEGINGIGFLVARRNWTNVCTYGPVGANPGDYHMKLGSTTGFYGSINEQGIVKLGYHGCFPPQ